MSGVLGLVFGDQDPEEIEFLPLGFVLVRNLNQFRKQLKKAHGGGEIHHRRGHRHHNPVGRVDGVRGQERQRWGCVDDDHIVLITHGGNAVGQHPVEAEIRLLGLAGGEGEFCPVELQIGCNQVQPMPVGGLNRSGQRAGPARVGAVGAWPVKPGGEGVFHLHVRIGPQPKEGGQRALCIDVDHQGPVAAQRKILAQMDGGGSFGDATFEVGHGDDNRAIGLGVTPGEEPQDLLDLVDFLERKEPSARGHTLAAREFPVVHPALQGLA